jgi:predicted ATPase
LLHSLVRKNSQFFIATHSPIILSYSDDACIYQTTATGLQRI